MNSQDDSKGQDKQNDDLGEEYLPKNYENKGKDKDRIAAIRQQLQVTMI